MNSKLFMPCHAMPYHAMPKREMFTVAYYVRNILTEIVAPRGVERSERRLVVHADNARSHPATVTRAFCDDNFSRIGLDPSNSPDRAPSDFACFLFGHLKNRLQSNDSNSGLQVNFFQASEKFWTKSALALWKRFSGSRLTDWTKARQHCSKWK
jgi:hypothetical protein